jgi:hypothetical protein
MVRGASKIKLKNANKKRTVTVRRVIFFLKAFIADLITLFSSSVQSSEGGGDGDSGDSCADPPTLHFYHFQRPKFNIQPLSFTFETFGKKLAKTKIVSRVNVKKIKAKKLRL